MDKESQTTSTWLVQVKLVVTGEVNVAEMSEILIGWNKNNFTI